MPASTAGLLRFFDEPGQGIKVSPKVALGFSILFVLISIALLILRPIP